MRAHLINFALIVLVAGCALPKNTAAQDLAWERWKQCDRFPTVTLKEIKTNGQTWVWTKYGDDLAKWRECDRAARDEQIKAGKFSAVNQPPMPEAERASLVKFAYFTGQPPAPGTYLRSAIASNMPPRISSIEPGASVTFFYALLQTGRVLDVETRWLTPDGQVFKVDRATIDQNNRPGAWTWRTQHREPGELREPGDWSVDLMVDGQSVGRYTISVKKH